MKSNDVLEALGEKGLYVVTSWEQPTLPCQVLAYREPRPVEEAEEIAHRAEPVADATGNTYEEALNNLLGKVG